MSEKDKVASIVALFPKPQGCIRINTNGEEPTPIRIANFQDWLEKCAMEIPYEEDELGLAGVVMKEDDYKGINNGVAFTPPQKPGTQPTLTVPQTRLNANGEPNAVQMMQHQQDIEDWKRSKKVWAQYRAGVTALRNLIVDNVDDEYISEIKHPKTQYKQIEPQIIMDHLKDYYGKVDHEAIIKMRRELMDYAWTPSTPITTMFQRFTEIMEASKLAKHGIQEDELVSYAMVIIRNTGLYNPECDEWETRANSYVWNDFQTYFVKESLKVKKHTSAQLGYADETAAAVLELSDKLDAVEERLQAEKTETINSLTATEIRELICQEINAASANNTPPATLPATKTFKKVDGAEGYTAFGQAIFYCHTHGITFNKNHRSATCTRKGENHDDTATLWNRKGGSDKMYDKKKKKT